MKPEYRSFQDLPLVLSVPQLAKLLGIGRNAAYDMVNSGSIRANIPIGPITHNMLFAVSPYDNKICVVRTTGQELLDAEGTLAPDVAQDEEQDSHRNKGKGYHAMVGDDVIPAKNVQDK